MKALLGIDVSLKAIDRTLDWHGQDIPIDMPILGLMKAAGFDDWLGCLPYAEAQIAQLQKRLDTASELARFGGPRRGPEQWRRLLPVRAGSRRQPFW